MNTGWFTSRKGIAIRKGDVLRITAAYDGELPHMGVMGVYHVYIAEGRGAAAKARAAERCAPLPTDAREVKTDMPHREDPPPIAIPLAHLVDGKPQTLEHPAGPLKFFASPLDRPLVVVDRMRYTPVNLSIAPGTTVAWRFDGRVEHKVQVANGPRAMGSPTLFGGKRYEREFTVPGVYQLFCYLHPMTMHQELTVRPEGG
jgi:hypothetical protein